MMNRLILWGLLTALVVGPATARAQAAAGFRAGVRSSGLDVSPEVERTSALVLGGYLGFGLSDRLALQVEVAYGGRGGSGLGLGADALDAGATPVELDMQYLEVPVLLRTGFPTDWLLPSFFAGPYAAFVLSCEVTPDGGTTTSCDDEAAGQRFSPRTTDFGMVVGAALDVAVGRSTLFVDARYTLGILSLQAGSDGFDARHNGVALTGGVAVPLGR